MASADRFDLAVVGGGPGGYGAALYAAGAGLRVALVERDKVGGTCLHRGCIPAKHFLETASVRRMVAVAAQFGVGVDQPGVAAGEEPGKSRARPGSGPSVDFAIASDRKAKVVDQLHRGLAATLKGKGVTTVAGSARLEAEDGSLIVRVAGSDGSSAPEALAADHVVLATGSVPRTLSGFDVDGRVVLTSDEVLDLRALPSRAVVIGGGAIGCEFASMLGDLGTEVVLLETAPSLLPGADPAVVEVLRTSFRRRGIIVHTGVKVHGHRPGPEGTQVVFGEAQSVETDAVIVCVGRRPVAPVVADTVKGLVVAASGFVVVDHRMQTGHPGVFAVGDVVATPALAHVAFAEAIVAAGTILGQDPVGVDYAKVPWCIYTHPEVAFAGLTEAAARQGGHDVVTSIHRYNGGRPMIMGETHGLVKLVAERTADGRAGRILGVHMVGPWVTEQLAQGWQALNWEATADDLAALIHPHPTLSETFGEAALALAGKGLHG
ncbi:MAG: FAD-dependent oxidoreductase [Acidimicrobiales bacterium]